MKKEGIEKAAELFREKIALAHNSQNRSQEILGAIREFLKDIGTNIESKENSPVSAQQEILPGVDQLIEKAANNNPQEDL